MIFPYIAKNTRAIKQMDVPEDFKVIAFKERSYEEEVNIGDNYVMDSVVVIQHILLQHETGFYIHIKSVKGKGIDDKMKCSIYYKGSKPKERAMKFCSEFAKEYGYFNHQEEEFNEFLSDVKFKMYRENFITNSIVNWLKN